LIIIENEKAERFGGFTGNYYDIVKMNEKSYTGGINFLFSLNSKKIFF
jgi:hypothetical protein